LRKYIHFFIFIFSLSIILQANDPAFLKKVRQSIKQIQPFQLSFVVQVISDGEVDDEESGEILFKNKDKIKWTYLVPDYKVFLLDGNIYKFYDKENEQLTIGNLKEADQHWVWQILLSEGQSPYIQCIPEKQTIIIKNEAENIDLEIIISSKFLPKRVVQNDPTGLKIVYQFKNYKKRIILKDSDFVLKVPTGIDILRLQ